MVPFFCRNFPQKTDTNTISLSFVDIMCSFFIRIFWIYLFTFFLVLKGKRKFRTLLGFEYFFLWIQSFFCATKIKSFYFVEIKFYMTNMGVDFALFRPLDWLLRLVHIKFYLHFVLFFSFFSFLVFVAKEIYLDINCNKIIFWIILWNFF